MRAFMHYRFRIGTKLPFPEWSEIVYRFLEKQSLHHEGFQYFFEDVFGGLERALKDCPQLGPVRNWMDLANRPYLSNFDTDGGCSENEIIALLPKIYRRYGVSSSVLIFRNVNCFEDCMSTQIQKLDHGLPPFDVQGSCIVLYRDSVFPKALNYIELQIEKANGLEIRDTSPYLEAMKELLPGIKYMEFMTFILTEEEKQKYDVLNITAQPLIEKAKTFLWEVTPAVWETDTPKHQGKAIQASYLKKLCKQYGYTYLKFENGYYCTEKRTERGHYIKFEVDTGKFGNQAGVAVRFCGAGFDHWLLGTTYYPDTSENAKLYVSRCFERLVSAEKEVIPELDSHFPPTPAWFVPFT